MQTFTITPIAAKLLDSVRASGRDVSGNPVIPVVAGGGEALRCCLRDARPEEALILFGYEPVIPASPYREIGPVFAHAESCAAPGTQAYPPDWRGRRQVLRAYDHRGWIHGSSREHDGTDPEATIEQLLADPDVVQIHSRNVVYGCYMFTIIRR